MRVRAIFIDVVLVVAVSSSGLIFAGLEKQSTLTPLDQS
jgi:hypothetical protein